jgi:hypothetical protein
MITRQRAVLRLLANEGGSASKLRLVKLAFLLREKVGGPSASVYDFLPYRHGPYSFTLQHELLHLERDGWIRVFDHEVITQRDCRNEVLRLDGSFRESIDRLSRAYRSVSTQMLVEDVYTHFPWYASNSNLSRTARKSAPKADLAVYTIGYEGLTLDSVLDMLLQTGIRRLIDVRCNPIARRFGFHKSTLERHCRDVGIAYVHIAELGIPSSWRASLSDLASYEHLFVRYEKEVLPKSTEVIERVCKGIREEPSALMCMESDARYCHRTRLAQVVAARTGLPLKELRS